MKLTKPKGVNNKVAWELAKEEVRRIMLTVDFESRISDRISPDKPVARIYAIRIVDLLTEAL